MSEPFVGEIRMFAGNFAPRGWAFCEGQLLAISENEALFSLLGTIYGGDGRTTFGLPDLRGRLPMHAGTGPGLSDRRLGAKRGTENVTVTVNQLPSHTHSLGYSAARANATRPANNTLATSASGDRQFAASDAITAMNNEAIATVGGDRQHSNMPPFLCIHFIIALVGLYPSRA